MTTWRILEILSEAKKNPNVYTSEYLDSLRRILSERREQFLKNLKVGDRVLCFNSSKFVNDVSTPLTTTFTPAIIDKIQTLSCRHYTETLYDVSFESGEKSKTHFEFALLPIDGYTK